MSRHHPPPPDTLSIPAEKPCQADLDILCPPLHFCSTGQLTGDNLYTLSLLVSRIDQAEAEREGKSQKGHLTEEESKARKSNGKRNSSRSSTYPIPLTASEAALALAQC